MKLNRNQVKNPPLITQKCIIDDKTDRKKTYKRHIFLDQTQNENRIIFQWLSRYALKITNVNKLK